MRPAERQQQIVDLVNLEGNTTVEALCARFNTSPETIRRDLGQLSALGKLRKVHGGATRASVLGEGPFYQRLRENVEAKRVIAKKAATLIEPGQVLFIDTGTTTLLFAEEIAKLSGLTVVSNSIDIIRTLDQGSGEDKTLYLLGGKYNGVNGETLGQSTQDQLQQFRPHFAVITVGAIHHDAGATDYDCGEANLASAMMTLAQRNIVLADSTKFDIVGGYHVAHLADIDHLVSDQFPAGKLEDRLRENNVDILGGQTAPQT